MKPEEVGCCDIAAQFVMRTFQLGADLVPWFKPQWKQKQTGNINTDLHHTLPNSACIVSMLKVSTLLLFGVCILIFV